jgi:prepilin-type N-terminal cleavage/methylation domain-containing protein
MRLGIGFETGVRQRGITLIELLAALVIAGFVVIMASRVFLAGNRQFLLRSSESQRLEEFYRLKGFTQGLLKRDVERCEAGKLSIRADGGEADVETLLKQHFPELTKAVFHCLEAATDRSSLVDWKDGFQPKLIEYRIDLKRNGKPDSLEGSWIK